MLNEIIDFHEIMYTLEQARIDSNPIDCIPNTTINQKAINAYTAENINLSDSVIARDIVGSESLIINLMAINGLLEKLKRPKVEIPKIYY